MNFKETHGMCEMKFSFSSHLRKRQKPQLTFHFSIQCSFSCESPTGWWQFLASQFYDFSKHFSSISTTYQNPESRSFDCSSSRLLPSNHINQTSCEKAGAKTGLVAKWHNLSLGNGIFGKSTNFQGHKILMHKLIYVKPLRFSLRIFSRVSIILY